MEVALVAKQVGVLAVLMAIGYVGTKKNIIDENVSKGLANILTSIALPAFLISSFNITYSEETLKGILLVFIYSLGIHILNAVITKFLYIKYNNGKNAVIRFGTIFGNCGFIGLPMIYELFGQEATLYGSVFLIPYHMVLWSYGESLLAKDKGDSPLKKLIKNPSLIAIAIGIVLFVLNIQLPYALSKSFSMLGSLTSPISMLILGEKITKLKFKEMIKDKDIYYGCFVKLIVLPVVTLGVMLLIKAPELIRNIMVFMQSLPVAILLVVLTQKHEGEIEFASKFAIISHIFCVITIPLISLLL
ncbi:MAG TPA: AEC family transporter [Tissierellaceae bacterium]